MIDPTDPHPAFYSESNQTSGFRFVRISNSKYDWTKALENKCSLCGSVQITTGYTLNHPSGIPTIVCVDCAGTETQFCGECDDEIDTSEIAETVEIPDDYHLPESMKHYAFICTECMDAPDTEDMFTINTPQEEITVKNDIKDTLNRIEDKVDAITDYMEGRKALYQDFYADEINEAELDAGLRRLWFRLKEV